MNEAFKLLATAVAALALIWVFMTYLVPTLFPATPIRNVLESGFESAQGMEGKLLTKPVDLRRGSALTADVLDSPTQSVNFRCTDAVQCCQQQQIAPGCKVAIDDRMLLVEQDGVMQVSFRCTYEQNIYLCSAYFGGEPAQLEITDVRLPKEIETGKDHPVLVLKVRNTGKRKAQDVIATAKVYKLTVADGRETEALHSGPFNRDLEEIAPGRESSLSIPLEVREPGNYKVRLEVRGVEAGRQTQEFTLKVRGANPERKCRATIPGRTKTEGTQCLQEYLCEGCDFDYECKLAWEPKFRESIADWSVSGAWVKALPEKCE